MHHSGRHRPRLGDVLVAKGYCTPQRIEEALGDQVVYDGRLGTNLLELGVVTEEQLARALSAQQGLPARWGDEIVPEPAALALVTPARAQRWQAIPLRLGRRRLDVLVSDVRDPTRLDEMAFAVGREVWPVLVAETRLWALLTRCYGVASPRRRPRGARPVVGAGPGPAAACPEPDISRFLTSDQEILAELQEDASRRFHADAAGRAEPGVRAREAAPAFAPARGRR